MNIEVTKYELMNMLMNTTDESVLEQILAVFKKTENQIEAPSIRQYNIDLAAAEARINQGKFTTQEDLEVDSEKW